jgi:LysM repeat protein
MRYIVLFTTLLSFSAYGSPTVVPDSVAARTEGGKKIIVHRVEPKETWFSLSRKYGVNVKLIQEANPGITTLQIGETVNVPASRRIVKSSTVITAQGTVPVPPPVAPREEPAARPSQSAPVEKHTVGAGETMYSIARKYSITVGDLKRWNNISGEGLQTGQVISVYGPATRDESVAVSSRPVARPSSAPPVSPAYREDPSVPAYLGKSDLKDPKPKKNRNPYSTDPWERLESLADTIVPGKPKVDTTKNYLARQRAQKPAGAPGTSGTPAATGTTPLPKGTTQPAGGKDSVLAKAAPAQKVYETPNLEPAPIPPSQLMKARRDSAQKSLREITEQGAAAWINDEQVNPSKFYALHKSAPAGTIIKVTNITSKQSVFVKVVGVLPDGGENSSLLIKISKAAAKKLNVTESKFQAELSYGVPQ